MYEVTHISPWVPARYVGIVVAVLSLFPGVLVFICEVTSGYYAADELVESLPYIIFPLVLGLGAYVGIGLALMLYNKVVGRFGGLELDLEFIEEKE